MSLKYETTKNIKKKLFRNIVAWFQGLVTCHKSHISEWWSFMCDTCPPAPPCPCGGGWLCTGPFCSQTHLVTQSPGPGRRAAPGRGWQGCWGDSSEQHSSSRTKTSKASFGWACLHLGNSAAPSLSLRQRADLLCFPKSVLLSSQ